MIDQLREAAKRSGKTQNQLAEAAGISQRAISVFLSGGGLSGESFAALAEALGITLKVPKKLRAH